MADKNKSFALRDGITANEEVLLSIAGLGALEVDGVDSLNGGITEKLMPKAGYNKLSKAVRIIKEEGRTISIQLIISVKYGHSILKVTESVQERVKSAVENMTEIKVKSVDVKVYSVNVNDTTGKDK